jgi:hypothetical protein
MLPATINGGVMLNRKLCLAGAALCCLLFGFYAHPLHAQGTQTQAFTSSVPVVSFNTLPALQPMTPIPNSSHVPGDFNGDGTSDLLWFNPTLSQVGYWTMSAISDPSAPYGGGVTRTGIHTFNVTPGYFVGAVGDFNNDGYADLVFTSANHDLYLWTNDQNGGFTSSYIGTYPNNWQLVGAGDVDGDGYDDLLWLDSSDCEFAYWTMKGNVRTGYKIIPITCGYYPIGVGYYTPSNRISILWTSAANDLYIWDSTGNGFKTYNLLSILSGTAWAYGGGYMGTGIGVQTNGGGFLEAGIANRTFDAQGNQTNYEGSMVWNGELSNSQLEYGSAGNLIEGNGINQTGLYILDESSSTISTGGLPGSNSMFSGNTVAVGEGADSWPYPSGWYVVGAPANNTATPPLQ